MPRGRPRKNPLPEDEKNIPLTEEKIPLAEGNENTPDPGNINTPPEDPNANISPSTSRKKSSNASQDQTCARCGQAVKGQGYKINLTYLLGGIASWWRDVEDQRPLLCHDCAHKMNKLIDDFMLKGGAESKWKTVRCSSIMSKEMMSELMDE